MVDPARLVVSVHDVSPATADETAQLLALAKISVWPSVPARSPKEAVDAAEELGVLLSVGRTGVCWDNAQQESFWSTLKAEYYDGHSFATRAEAIAADIDRRAGWRVSPAGARRSPCRSGLSAFRRGAAPP